MNIDNFYKKNNINYNNLQLILLKANIFNPKYMDLYIQVHEENTLILENGMIKNIHTGSFKGISLRCIKNNITGMISLNNIDYNFFLKNLFIIEDILNEKKNFYNKKIKINFKKNTFLEKNKKNINFEKKIFILNKIYNSIKNTNKKIKEISVSLSSLNDDINIINKQNSCINNKISIILKIFLTIEYNKKYSVGFSSICIKSKIEDLDKNINDLENCTYIEKCIFESINMALINLNAKDSPYGNIPVVLGPGCPGILLHEAIGHGLESDFIRKKTSIFHNKKGEKIASENCTVIDDGTIKNLNGSINIDDEGNPGKYNILIKNGILNNFMYDNYNAIIMNEKSTGNGRRESYDKNIMPRMTNTYLLPGIYNPNDIISSIDHGIYATNFTDGQVDISSGKFVFSTSVAFLIKNGKISNPIKKVTLIGSSIDIMKNISMIGNDFKMDLGSSICIKNGQSIPVSVGQPTIKINNITVGGTK